MQTLPPSVDQLAGKVLGHYQVKQLLGHGNVNAIYAAQKQPQGQTVMLTAFTMPETFSPQARERFLTRFTQVASKLVRLDHPYILPTYDFGAQFGYPYLITPFVTGGSLAKVMQQETRCTPERVLQILKQIAAGLDYAHQNGIVHGALKPATILLDDEQNVRITGFGVVNILKRHGIEAVDFPYAHLTSIGGTFLGAAEYIAPEVVQGDSADTRSDVYAVGIMRFELLTGELPFRGDDPISVAMQHVQRRVPSLQTVSPAMLPGLDLVVQRAVEFDPAQRFQSVSKLAKAFERVLEVLHGATSPAEGAKEVATSPIAEMTMPPTVNWDEEIFAAEHSSTNSPTMTGHMPVVTNPRIEAGNWQLRPPIVTNQMAAIKAMQRPVPFLPQSAMEKGTEDKNAPFTSWTSDSAAQMNRQDPGTFKSETSKRAEADTPKGTRKGRRRVVALLATGVVAAGIVGVGGIELTRFLHPQQSRSNYPTSPAQPLSSQAVRKTPVKQQKAVVQAKQAPAQPAKKVQPQARTGVVIGMTTQAPNSAKDFKNPADHNDSLLVRLPDGTFTAYERACTHQQVAVNYEPATKTFVCPLHGSIFDPAQHGKVLQGPATLPLPPVKVQVNGDGTVTAL